MAKGWMESVGVMRADVQPKDATVVPVGAKRRCAGEGCVTLLRQGNPDCLCAACARRDRKAERTAFPDRCPRGCGRRTHRGRCAEPRSFKAVLRGRLARLELLDGMSREITV
jgi:hypothetical protein